MPFAIRTGSGRVRDLVVKTYSISVLFDGEGELTHEYEEFLKWLKLIVRILI